MEPGVGYQDGAHCNRALGRGDNPERCVGTILEPGPENCSCHIRPPCAACMIDTRYCTDCDWDPENDS